MSRRNPLALAVAAASVTLASAAAAPTAVAQGVDPASTTVTTLNDGLLAIMRAGSAAGQSGRARQIAPVIDRTFDLPQMTRLAVGPSWVKLTPADQSALVAAFRALTVAQYAKNFDGFSGERFTVAPQVETRGGDKLVRTTLVMPKGSTEALNYRLRESGGQWKIIDVYYRNAISQLATRRADFAKVLASGGAKALVAHLQALAARPS
jgi:phospholipid transport system substrate-binding protein